MCSNTKLSIFSKIFFLTINAIYKISLSFQSIINYILLTVRFYSSSISFKLFLFYFNISSSSYANFSPILESSNFYSNNFLFSSLKHCFSISVTYSSFYSYNSSIYPYISSSSASLFSKLQYNFFILVSFLSSLF